LGPTNAAYSFDVGNAARAARLVAKDRSAFAAMYGEYAGRVYGVCAAILRDADEAADAMHDTFVLAMQRIDQLRDPDRLRPWLFAIARHVCFRRLEHRKRSQPTADVDLVQAEAAEQHDEFTDGEAAALLWAAAQGLNDRDRAVLALNLQEGLDGEELAAALGVRHANPYSLVHRARAQLDRALGALIIARLGRDDCAALSRLLTGWDGALTPLMRKRLARHLDACDVCQRTNARARRISALSALTQVAPAPAEAMSATNVFDIASRAPVSTERWLPDGFPPYLDAGQGRRRLVLVAIGLGVVGALVLAVGLASSAGHAGSPVVSSTPVATDVPSGTTVPAHTRTSTATTIGAPAPTVAGATTPTTPVTVHGIPATVPPHPVTPPPGPPVTRRSPPTTVKASPPTTHAPAKSTTTTSTTFSF
jgi:RNA polymerase sigma factor (sigma-70 family)